MELVYLWVEDYKNIQKQGFNFSPRFECHYDGAELTICDKKGELAPQCKNNDYIEDFFGKDINVTAIVGKNGSGKSSVLEFLLDRLAERYEDSPKNFIFIYSYENKLYAFNNFKYNIDKKVNINSFSYDDHILQYHDDLITLHINSEYKDIVSRDTQQIFSENNKYDKKSSNLIFLENYIKNKKELDKLDEKIFIPHNLKISIKESSFFHSALHDDRDYYSNENWEKIQEVIGIMENKSFKEYIETLHKLFKYKEEFHINYNKGLSDLFTDRKKPHKYNFNGDLLKNIPPIINDCDSSNIKLNISDIDSDTLKYIEKLPYVFEIDLYDKSNKSFDELSFGEKQLLNQLHYILLHSTKKDYIEWIPPRRIYDENDEAIEIEEYNEVNKIKNILIFLDEFEIGLHPEWQKKTINYFINFLKILDIKIHIILTSHSPFLLSDIPKQNIIFLDKDEKGNCKVVDGLKEKNKPSEQTSTPY